MSPTRKVVYGLKNIFVMFMMREGFSKANAEEEFSRLEGKENCDAYLTTVRIGASFKLDRAARRGVWLSYENAKNHAAFESEVLSSI